VEAQNEITEEAGLNLQKFKEGFMLSQCGFLAMRLNLPELLAGQEKTVAQMAQETDTQARPLACLLGILSSYGFVQSLGGERYGATPALPLLGEMCHSLGDRFSYQSWGESFHTLKTDKPSWDKVFGKPYYASLHENREAADNFDSLCKLTAEQGLDLFLSRVDYSTVNYLVDLGGNTGTILTGILKTYPHLKGTVFDIPAVVAKAETEFREAGVEQRATAVGGSFFDNIPKGGDMYSFFRVLLNWSDKDALQILKNTAAAMAVDGTLVVVDYVMPDPDHAQFRTLSFGSMNLMVNMGGYVRSDEQWRELLHEASFKVSKVTAIPDYSINIIEARRR